MDYNLESIAYLLDGSSKLDGSEHFTSIEDVFVPLFDDYHRAVITTLQEYGIMSRRKLRELVLTHQPNRNTLTRSLNYLEECGVIQGAEYVKLTDLGNLFGVIGSKLSVTPSLEGIRDYQVYRYFMSYLAIRYGYLFQEWVSEITGFSQSGTWTHIDHWVGQGLIHKQENSSQPLIYTATGNEIARTDDNLLRILAGALGIEFPLSRRRIPDLLYDLKIEQDMVAEFQEIVRLLFGKYENAILDSLGKKEIHARELRKMMLNAGANEGNLYRAMKRIERFGLISRGKLKGRDSGIKLSENGLEYLEEGLSSDAREVILGFSPNRRRAILLTTLAMGLSWSNLYDIAHLLRTKTDVTWRHVRYFEEEDLIDVGKDGSFSLSSDGEKFVEEYQRAVSWLLNRTDLRIPFIFDERRLKPYESLLWRMMTNQLSEKVGLIELYELDDEHFRVRDNSVVSVIMEGPLMTRVIQDSKEKYQMAQEVRDSHPDGKFNSFEVLAIQPLTREDISVAIRLFRIK